jgi:hypothetical protein
LNSEVLGLVLLGLLYEGGVRVADKAENVVRIGRGCVLRRMVVFFLIIDGLWGEES